MFTIPNAANAEDATQAQIDERDFRDIIIPAFSGTGVVSGCAVTAQASPNMTVAIAGGSVAIGGTVVGVSGGNVTIGVAHASLARFDLICVNAAGVKTVMGGTAAANPVFPDPGGLVVLAAVRVPGAATFITSQKIVDKRVAPAATSQQLTPTGVVSPFAGAAAPVGWLLCDGTAVPRTNYATLFALIGTTYGAGDGSTTFNIPDIRGRIAIGLGTHVDVNTLGKNDGAALAARRAKHSHTNGLTLPTHAHSHSFTLPAHAHNHTFQLPNHSHANSLAIPNHTHNHSLAMPDHVHSHSLTLPTHTHGHSFVLPSHAHNHSLSLPNHAHAINDPGHTHQMIRQADQSGGPFPPVNGPQGGTIDNITTNGTGITVGAITSTPAVNGSVDAPTALPSINGGVSAPQSLPNIAGAVIGATTLPGVTGAIGNPPALPGLGGSVDNPTTNPTITGAVGNPSTTPGIDGAVGNNSSAPAIPGIIGDIGMLDSPAYITLNYIIKT